MTRLTWPDPLPTDGAVRLRPYADTDLGLVAELAEDPYLPLIGTIPAEYSEAEGLAYLARQHQRLADGTGYSFAVARRVDDLAVGGAGLWLTDDPATARAGYAISPRHRGSGYAMAALCALTRFAWTSPALRSIDLHIEPDNPASIAVAVSAGYVRRGRLAAHSAIGGRLRDMEHYQVRRP